MTRLLKQGFPSIMLSHHTQYNTIQYNKKYYNIEKEISLILYPSSSLYIDPSICLFISLYHNVIYKYTSRFEGYMVICQSSWGGEE